MTDVSVAADTATAGGRSRPNYIFWFALSWLILITVVTVLGEALPFVDDPRANDPSRRNAGPSWDNWFGNTSFGRDVFSQVVVGGRVSLRVAGIVTAIGIVVGGGMGLLAGYLKGWVDGVVQFIVAVTLSVPALLLVIFIVAIRGQSLNAVILAVSLLAIPALARIVRASTLQVADREYVKAAQVIGAKKLPILVREVLPNVMPTLISFAFLTTGIVLVAESSLSFLGLSVKAPTITWGSIISEGRQQFSETPHMVFTPALVLFLTVLSLNFVGDQLLKRFDIKESAL